MADSAEIFTMAAKITKGNRWLYKGWVFNPQDSIQFSGKDYNHRSWRDARPSLNYFEIGHLSFNGFGWFRYTLVLDSAERQKPHALYVEHKGAMELYVNGKLCLNHGNVSLHPDKELRYCDSRIPVFLPYTHDGIYQIAIKYSNSNYKYSYNASGMQRAGFDLFIKDSNTLIREKIHEILYRANFGLPLFGFFSTVTVLHFLLFLFYRERRSNLYFSLFTLILSFYFFSMYAADNIIMRTTVNEYVFLTAVMLLPVLLTTMQSVLYSMFYDRFTRFFKALFVFSLMVSVSFFVSNISGFLLTILLMLIVVVDSIRIIIKINMEKHNGALLVTFGYAIFVLFFLFAIVKGVLTGSVNLGSGNQADDVLLFMFMTGIISIPLSMSVYLARDFATTNRVLAHKLKENQILSERSIQQEQEKQRILASQNEVLEIQVKERTFEIEEQKKVIEEKNKDITDSINYAQRIQKSILPTEAEIKAIFPDSFVLFKPRDIVSGDFYQFKKKDDYRYAIMADCTGHGVPGALMSMIGSNLLHQIIMERGILMPQYILAELHKEVKRTLRQTEGVSSHDGMDISIALCHHEKLYIASANRPVFLIHKNELLEIKPTKHSIGGSSTGNDAVFDLNEFTVSDSQTLYMFSDGYADQFGGQSGKKFKVKNFSNLLMESADLPLKDQLTLLDTSFNNWRGALEQVDDVCVIGIKLP